MNEPCPIIRITGVKFVLLDYAEPKASPPPQLPFPTGRRYLPAAVSTLKNIESAVVTAIDLLPAMGARVAGLLERIDRVMDEFQSQKMPARAGASLDQLDRTLRAVQETLAQADVPRVSTKAQAALDGMAQTLAGMDQLFTRIESEHGLLSHAERTTQLVGDAAQGGTALELDMQALIDRMAEATESFRRLADALERDPDMLLKGRAKGKQR